MLLKPSEDPESSAFQFAIWGPEVDHVKLSSDTSALFDFVAEQSGMAKQVFGELIGFADYR